MTDSGDVDVVIVGAGVAGLAAARRLTRVGWTGGPKAARLEGRSGTVHGAMGAGYRAATALLRLTIAPRRGGCR